MKLTVRKMTTARCQIKDDIDNGRIDGCRIDSCILSVGFPYRSAVTRGNTNELLYKIRMSARMQLLSALAVDKSPNSQAPKGTTLSLHMHDTTAHEE